MPGPYVQLATFCEKTLQEQDGVLTLVRVIDRIIVTAHDQSAPAELPPGPVTTTFVLTLKSDDARGRHPVTLRFQQPDGQYLPDQTVDVLFEGEDRGLNIISEMHFLALEGLYWLEVLVNSALLTRVSLRVLYQRIPGSA